LARAVASDAGASAPDPSKGSLQSTLQKFFHPVAALAYLLLLLLSFPVYRLLTPSEPAHPSPVVTGATPQVPLPSVPEGLRGLRLLRLTGDVAFRGGAKQEPARLVLRPEEALALKLFPELEDLPRDPVASLTIRVLEGGKEQASARRQVGDLEADESFLLLLDPGMLQAGKTYRVELRVDSPAPRVVLTQAFRLDAR
jgi:hypothetical protein